MEKGRANLSRLAEAPIAKLIKDILGLWEVDCGIAGGGVCWGQPTEAFWYTHDAIQVAPRPRKGKIPPESAFQNRELTSLFARDSGHRAIKGEAHVS